MMYFLAALKLIHKDPFLCGHLFPSRGRFMPRKSRPLPGLTEVETEGSKLVAVTFDAIDVARNIDSQKNPDKNPL
jgi:hypothetical protein